MRKLVGCLALLGCVSGCAGLPGQTQHTLAETLPPAPNFIPIQIGQTIDADAPKMFRLRARGIDADIPLFDFYRFSAEPAQTVTITMRSKGGDTALSVLDSYGHDNIQLIESVSSLRFSDAARARRVRGEHSEVIFTLPPDEDGIYYIQPTMGQNGFSLTLKAGSVPAQDIVQKPSRARP